MKLQVGVKILLRNKKGKYLLVKRSSKKYPEIRRRWDAVGGRINPGSTLIDNLKREIREETGLKLEKEPRLVAAQDILQKTRHVVRLTFVGEIRGKPILNKENEELKWVSRKELSKMKGLDIYLKQIIDKKYV